MSKTVIVMQSGKDRPVLVLSGKMFPEQKEMHLSWNPTQSSAILLWEKDLLTTKGKERINGMIRGWRVYPMGRDDKNKHWVRNSYMGLSAMRDFWKYFLLFLQVKKSIQKGK